jgi:hypothetical protein
MLQKSDRVFLLLSRCVDISKKQWNVVPADQGHPSSTVKTANIYLVIASGGIIRLLTLIYCLVWDAGFACTSRGLPCFRDSLANLIDLGFREYVFGIVIRGSISSTDEVGM